MYIIFQNSRFIITLLLSNKLLFKNHKLKFSTLKNQCTKFYHYLMNSKKKINFEVLRTVMKVKLHFNLKLVSNKIT